MIGLNLAKVSGTPVIEDGHSPCFVNPANSKENIAMSYMWLIGFKLHGTSLPHLTLKLSFRIYYSYIKLYMNKTVLNCQLFCSETKTSHFLLDHQI